MLLPHCSQNKEIQVIWAKFMDIIGDLKLDFTTEEGILELQRNHGLNTFSKCTKQKM